MTVKPGQSDFITCLMHPGESQVRVICRKPLLFPQILTVSPQTFSQEQPVIDPESLALFSTVLGRPIPDEAEVARRLAEL